MGFCVSSKAAILVLLWNVFVGVICSNGKDFVFLNLFMMIVSTNIDISFSVVSLYSLTAIVYLFYPLSGFLADVYFGRFNTVSVSLTSLVCSFIAGFLSLMLCLLHIGVVVKAVLFFFGCFCFLITMLSITSYKANSVQFGLDQLLEAPNQHQALFVHWAKWCYDLLSMIVTVIIALNFCKFDSNRTIVFKAFLNHHSVPLAMVITPVILFIFVILLIIGCIKRDWFYSEPRGQNPYKMVTKVLNFVRKYKYPLQRSAFTYCDDERPLRLDFAKERFGGPFTTEQVEDVKTFLKIMIILLAVGPVSILDIASSDVIFSFIGLHVGFKESYCDLSGIIVNSGLLRYIVSTLFLPVYVWITFYLLQNQTPRILYRLGFGISFYIFGVLSILIIDVFGHLQYDGHQTECIFEFTFNNTESHVAFDVPHLGISWEVYVICNFFIGIGSPLVTVTVFEFISAQSPRSMKGLLLGMYYLITGVYQFIGSVALIPFSVLHTKWAISSHVSCLFGYLVLICVVGTLGLVLFLVASWWYKYRVREDRPYDQRFVVDIYDRYLDQASTYSYSYSSESD